MTDRRANRRFHVVVLSLSAFCGILGGILWGVASLLFLDPPRAAWSGFFFGLLLFAFLAPTVATVLHHGDRKYAAFERTLAEGFRCRVDGNARIAGQVRGGRLYAMDGRLRFVSLDRRPPFDLSIPFSAIDALLFPDPFHLEIRFVSPTGEGKRFPFQSPDAGTLQEHLAEDDSLRLLVRRED
jgi:hypothetical protein